MGRDISINIDLERLGKGIAQIDRLSRAFEDAIYLGLQDLARLIEARLEMEMSRVGLSGSTFQPTIRIFRRGILIQVEGEEAMFVEYGTGVVGERNPHPDPQSVGQYDSYDSQGHGDAGWYYGTPTGMQWTKGQPAKPFMYRTWDYGRRMAVRTINRQIRRIKV